MYFAGISSVIRDCRRHWRQSCISLTSSATTPDMLTDGAHSQETLRAHLRIVRSYGVSLTLGLIMNTIVRMYYPDQDHALAQTSQKSSEELISLAKQATQFKPLGATFMAPFLNTVWAVGDLDSRTQMVPALRRHEIDFEVERATILSGRLKGLLDDMRGRILAQSSQNTSSCATPLPSLPHEATEIDRHLHPAELADGWHVWGPWGPCT